MSQLGFSLTSLWDGLFDPGETVCLNRANNSPQVKSIDTIIDNLAKNWRPTGYYKPDEMQQAFDMLATAVAESSTALAAAPDSTSDAASQKSQIAKDVARAFTDVRRAYMDAIAKARASGMPVNAPDFKNTAIKVLLTVSQSYVLASVLECRETALLRWLRHAYDAISTIAAFLLRMAKLAAAAIEAAANAAYGAIKNAFSFAAWLVKYGPYIIGAGGLYVGYVWIRKLLPTEPTEPTQHALPAGDGVQGVEKTLTPTQTRTLKIIKARGSEGRYLYTREKGYNLQAAHALLKMGVIRIVGSVTIDGVDMPRVSAI